MPLVVRIFQHDFPIRRQFSAGHILTEAEANSLNHLLIENVRNNTARWVARELADQDTLTLEQHKALAARISDYADSYAFGAKRSKNLAATPIDITIREIAMQRAEVWGNQNGLEPDSQEVLDKFAELKLDPAVREAARELVLQRQTVADKAVAGLL